MRLLMWGSGPSGKGLHINAGCRVFRGGPRAPLRHRPALRRHDLVLDLGLEPHLLAPTQIRYITYTTSVECHCVRALMIRVYAAQLMAHVWGHRCVGLSQGPCQRRHLLRQRRRGWRTHCKSNAPLSDLQDQSRPENPVIRAALPPVLSC